MVDKQVSIIITCYNSENTIVETLKSVRNQCYNFWECIIIDDCSTDKSTMIIKQFIKDDDRFNLIINENNLGQAKSLNIGIKNSNNKYIMFLDSDDLLLSTCISNRFNFDFNDFDFLVFPNHTRFSKEIGDLGESYQSQEIKNPLKNFIVHKLPTPWNIMSAIWKKEAILKINGFNEAYIRMVDVEFSTKALIYGLKYKVIFIEPDHFYRVTTNKKSTEIKRQNFYFASFTFLTENTKILKQVEDSDAILIKKYMFQFYLKVFSMTLVSKQFSEKDAEIFLKHAIRNNLILKNAGLYLHLISIKKILEKPIIRSIFWRTINKLIDKNLV